jgi:hypothetical protein
MDSLHGLHARSPDLNPLDFYLWEHLKTHLYAAPVGNEEALYHHIVDAGRTVRNYAGISERMRRSMMKRVEACTESHGGHFEHQFRCTLSAVTHKLNVSGYVFIWPFILVLICENRARNLSPSFSCILYISYGMSVRSPNEFNCEYLEVTTMNISFKTVHPVIEQR